MPAAESAVEEPPAPKATNFEVDHKVDPDWPDQQEVAAMTGEPENAADAGSEPSAVDYDAVLEALRRGQETESASQEPPVEEMDAQPVVKLTEVVGDKELFEDPSLDIARMAAGQEREILIPVEFKDGEKALHRFKLSVKLRLDQVD